MNGIKNVFIVAMLVSLGFSTTGLSLTINASPSPDGGTGDHI